MISERLKAARLRKKLTQQELAERLNTTKGTISNYENGHSTPSNELLRKISLTLEVSADYLIGVADEIQSSSGGLSQDEREMLEFFRDPENEVFYKELKNSPEARRQAMLETWELIKKHGLDKD